MPLDEECVRADRFAAGDEDYEGFWNCLIYTFNTRNYKTKIETLQSFCAACKVTFFGEFLMQRLLVTDEK